MSSACSRVRGSSQADTPSNLRAIMASCSVVYMDWRVPSTSRIRLWGGKMAVPFMTCGSSCVSGKHPWIPLMCIGRSNRKFAPASTPTVISNNKIYTRMGNCLVIPPPNGLKPRAIVKFLGGAFVGAAPEVTYSHLMYLLAMEGFLVISVPYNVTFDHAKATREVYERFHACMDMLCVSGLPSAKLSSHEILHLPLYSVGHSNGALLQVLTGSYFSEKIPKANAIVSFNNRPASEAVPYFEQFGPFMSQMVPLVEASPLYEIVRNASGDAWKTMFDTAAEMIRRYDEEVMVSLSRFLEQLPLVMNQVIQGVSEFTPTPPENRDYFKKFYNVPHTLLVKFNFDAIDETDLLEEVLRPRIESMGGTVEKVILSGTHITPCIQDVTWHVGDVYTPVDAIAQTLKSLSVNDTKVLARTLSSWFSRFDD